MGLPPSGFGLWGSMEEVTAIPGIREQSPAWHTLPSTLRGVARPAHRSSPASCWEHGQDLCQCCPCRRGQPIDATAYIHSALSAVT